MKGFFPVLRMVLVILTFLCCGGMLGSPTSAQKSLQNSQTDSLIQDTVRKFYALGKEKNIDAWKLLWHENAPTLVRREKDFKNSTIPQTEEMPTVNVVFVKAGRDRTFAEAEVSLGGTAQKHLGLIKEGSEWKIWHEADAEILRFSMRLSGSESTDGKFPLTSAVEILSSLNWIGYSFYESRNYQSAVNVLLLARKYAQEKGEKEIWASTSILIGHNYLESAQLESALEFYAESRDLSQKADFEVGYLRSLSGIGNVCNKLGRYYEARDALETRLRVLRKSSASRNRLLITLKNLGNVYYRMGDFEKALRLYEESAALGPPEAGLLLNIGFILTEQKRFPEAEKKFRESLAIANQNQQKEEVFRALNGLGMISLEQENYPNALNFFKQSVEENAANKLEQSQILLNQGFAQYKLKNFDSAMNLTGQALTLAQETNFAESLWFGNYLKGRILRTQNKLPEALQSHLQAIQTIDRLLAQSPDFDNLESLFDKIEPYKETSDLLTLQNRNEEALNYSERAKAKILLRSLRGKSAVPETVSFNLRDAEGILTDSETALIEYLVTEETTVIFLITKPIGRRNSLQLFVRRINYGRRQLEKTITEFNQRVASVNYDLSQPQNELYNVLIRPIEKNLSGKNKLIIVPDGALWSLPFQALKADSDRYLLDSFAITYARSLKSLVINRNRKERGLLEKETPNILAISGGLGAAAENRLGDIPYAEESVAELSSLYGSTQSTVFTRNNATKERIKSVIANFRVIHFAVHGVLNERNPMLSYLQLTAQDETDNGKLEAHEIQNLNLDADLVILAGCETGRGKIIEGEGIIGLTWAVEKAGASVVIVSQWKVRDKSTRDLMLEFHRLWREKSGANKKLSAAESLRMAALAIQKKYPHPVYWAAFVAIGDAFRV